MADKHYIGEVGTVIRLDCGVDISAADVTTMKVKKPDGSTVEWAATVFGTNFIDYTTTSGDFIAGVYQIQSYIEIGGWIGRGNTATFTVFDLFG